MDGRGDRPFRVSVVIPVYDCREFLEEAVRSCLAQPEVAEVLLVDDGSTDGSRELAERLAAAPEAAGRVRALRHPDGGNHGIAATRNRGVREARAPWLAFLDADDRYAPGRFAEAARLAAAHPDLDGVYEAVGTHFEDEALRAEWAAKRRPLVTTLAEPVAPEALFETLVRGGRGHLHTAGIAIRRELVETLGGFDTRLAVGEDTALWLRAAAAGRLAPGRLDRAVAERRARRGSITDARWDEYAHYHGLLWEGLLDWAEARPLSRARRQAVLSRLVHHRMRECDGGGRLGRRLRRLGLAARLAARRPGALANRTWWRWVGWSLGVPGRGRADGATA